MSTTDDAGQTPAPIDRRDFLGRLYRVGTVALGGLIGLVLAVPGAAYVLDPLRRRAQNAEFRPLVRLSELKPNVPRSFPIIEARQDAWVKYPPEPVGSVWLVRQPEGSKEPVIAFTAECPHLGCAVGLGADGQGFFCPCHTSSFDLEGHRTNAVPPRGMDTLEVRLSQGDDPEVSVRFQRFRTMSKEKIPLG